MKPVWWTRPSDDPVEFGQTAPHIRGRAVRQAPGSYKYEVVNLRTGATLTSDGPFGCLEAAMTNAARVTAVYRGAWFFGLRRKELK